MGGQMVLLALTVCFHLDLLDQHQLALERVNMLGFLASKERMYLRKERLLVVYS